MNMHQTESISIKFDVRNASNVSRIVQKHSPLLVLVALITWFWWPSLWSGQVIVHADVKSVEGNTSKENMKKCKIQGKYAGTVEDIHKGTVFVRLSIGVNAIAHSCYDSRTVGKKDQVSFVVTHIDEERNVALGIITRIIKQTI